MKSRIMYIESKSARHAGLAHIGRVAFSKSGATLYYAGRSFQSVKGSDLKSNYLCVETDEWYLIADVRPDGRDNLDAPNVMPEVDADVHEEYWSKIRGLPLPPRNQDEPA